jgi:hypothetical protein
MQLDQVWNFIRESENKPESVTPLHRSEQNAMVQLHRRRNLPFTPDELRRAASSRRNTKTEAFRAGEDVKASRIQE